MVGWLMIAVTVVALAAVVRWSLKGGGFGGYSEADQAAVKRDELDMRLSQQDDEEHRSRARWRGLGVR